MCVRNIIHNAQVLGGGAQSKMFRSQRLHAYKWTHAC